MLLIYWGLNYHGKTQLALSFLVPASFLFYAYWNPPFIFLLLGSIVFNFSCGQYIANGKAGKKYLFWLAVFVNLGLLLWFKYAILISSSIIAVAEISLDPGDIFLPLGISFFTFHQLTYLADIYKGKISPAGFRDYALYVGFFPQLIAGPIVRAWEIIPQFQNFSGHEKFWKNMALGISLFITGLFKKVVIADTLSRFASPIFNRADNGEHITFFDGWTGALAYTFQLYFDFSGYSDMALGLGLMLGFVLPINFLSPYKSTSIIDFWRRWHMTMSRFFRDYLYIPLGGSRVSGPRQITNLFLTMFLAGLWHGAGWTFAAWGLLHGFYLAINHIFAEGRKKYLPTQIPEKLYYKITAHFLTMLAVVVGWVLFRAESFESAWRILKAMAGAEGIVLPWRVFGSVDWLKDGWIRVAQFGEMWLSTSYWSVIWIILAYIICISLPSSAEYFGLVDSQSKYKFTMNKKTALAVSLAAVIALLSMQRVSEFLYFQF